jgi:PKD repeat protein
MASVQILCTAVAYNDWNLYGGASVVAAMNDGDNSTGVQNYNPLFVHNIWLYNDNASQKPANMVGATITGVSINWGMYESPNRGTFNVTVNGVGTGPTIGPGTGNSGSVDVTAFKSWLHTDFYSGSGTTWGYISNGDADDGAKIAALFYLTLTVTYTPPTPPVAAFTVSTTTGTSPLSVNFTDQGTNTPTSWLWTFGDSSTSTSQNPVHVYSTPAVYTVTFTETNAGGSSNISTANLITVLASAASVVAQFTATPTSGLQNLSVMFFDASTGTPMPTSWFWTFGDSSTSTNQNPTHVYTTVGVYTVTLTATSTVATVTWQTDSEQKTSYITVSNGVPVPLAQYLTGTVLTTVATTGIRPYTLLLRGSATNALPTRWGWDYGDGLGSVVEDPTHVYTTVGTFTPTLTVTNAVGTASTTLGPITVNFNPIIAGYTAAPRMGYIPLTVRFTDQTIGDVNSWAWNFGDTLTSSDQNPVHTYQTAIASVALTVSQTGFSDAFDLRHGLVNYWKMEETTGAANRADFIGSKPLVVIGSVTQVAGKQNFASQFGVAISASTTFSDHSSRWSYSGWIKPSTLASSQAIILIGEFSSLYILTSGKILLNGVLTGTTVLAINTFYHIVLTYDGTSIYKLYINGVLELTHSILPAFNSSFSLRNSSDTTVMILDEFGRYNLTMDQDQITGLYNAGAGLFFSIQSTSGSIATASQICPITPDRTYGYFFEEMKYQLMEPMWDQDVCTGFTDFGGMQKVLDFTQQRLNRFVLESACLRKEATLAAATTDTEDYPLPADLIELLRVEVGGVTYYPADDYQRDRDSALNIYIVDGLNVTIPGLFGTSPVIKVLYTYLPTAPTVPAPCTCPTPPAIGPWGYFPLPYTLWWIIRYGVMADLFTQAGLRNDPQRAGKCEELFQQGTEIYKMLYRGNN